MPSSATINQGVTELTSGLEEARVAIAAALRAGTYSERQLRHLVATLEGYHVDLDEIIAIIDVLDVESFLLLDNGHDTIVLWRWVHGLRHELGRLGSHIRQAQAVADSLVDGVDHRTHVVVSGQTLQAIAAMYLGSWREWSRIAQINGLAPGQPASGTILTIPPRR